MKLSRFLLALLLALPGAAAAVEPNGAEPSVSDASSPGVPGPVPAGTPEPASSGTVPALDAPPPRSQDGICGMLAAAAAANGLPAEYFARVIWRESAFDTRAVSPAGALGVAQFMPGTAAERGLADPFDAAQAIKASAHLLRDLRQRFGNLGLAAAGYNAGPARVQDWLEGRGGLPAETRAYVAAITGRSAEDWRGLQDGAWVPRLIDADALDAACRRRSGVLTEARAVPSLIRSGADAGTRRPVKLPRHERAGGVWLVELAKGLPRGEAQSLSAELGRRHAGLLARRRPVVARTSPASRGADARYGVRIPMPSRDSADTLCLGLRARGGVCIVQAGEGKTHQTLALR